MNTLLIYTLKGVTPKTPNIIFIHRTYLRSISPIVNTIPSGATAHCNPSSGTRGRPWRHERCKRKAPWSENAHNPFKTAFLSRSLTILDKSIRAKRLNLKDSLSCITIRVQGWVCWTTHSLLTVYIALNGQNTQRNLLTDFCYHDVLDRPYLVAIECSKAAMFISITVVIVVPTM